MMPAGKLKLQYNQKNLNGRMWCSKNGRRNHMTSSLSLRNGAGPQEIVIYHHIAHVQHEVAKTFMPRRGVILVFGRQHDWSE